jgi:hypothetical protein
MPDFPVLLHQIFQEHFVYGHLPYILLIVSVLMRNITWLRVVAIVAGLLRIYIRAEIVYVPVTVMWESALVLINVGQLLLLWWDRRHERMSEDEQFLARSVLRGESRSTAIRLLRSGEWREVEAGTPLTVEGEKVPHLMFVAEGAARIVKGGQMVAICSRGEFLGEMSFISGDTATATAVADKPMRIITFDNQKLTALMQRDPRVRRGIEASFNRDLMAKLSKSTGSRGERAA